MQRIEAMAKIYIIHTGILKIGPKVKLATSKI